MRDWLFKKINWYVGCLAVAALFGLIALATNIEIKDIDLWLHLAVGKFITQSFTVPKVDILSCTIANAPWINHEWLFQIIVYSIYSTAGISGLINLKVLVVFLTFTLLLFLGYPREAKIGPIVVLLLVFLVYQLRLTLRPDMFSLLFFVLYILLLGMHLDKRWTLWAVAFIQIVWTNMHGFFVIGPAVITLCLVGEWSKRHAKLPFEWNSVGRISDGDYKNLKLMLPVVLLACLANPHFIKGAWYPISVLFSLAGDSQIFFKEIQELQRPLQWGTLFSLQAHLHYKLLILISLFSFAVNYKKIDMNILLLWLLLLLSSLSAVRNIVFFSLAAYLAFLRNTQNMSLQKYLPSQCHNLKFRTICSAAMAVILIAWIIDYGDRLLLRGYYDFDKFERKNELRGVSLRNFPDQAADFLVENDIKGNFFNDFNSGAYLLGRTFPNIKVFIDGRTEVYGPDFFKEYNDIWKGNVESFDEAADRYRLTGAFLSYVYVPAPAKTIRHLYEQKEWVLVYFDYDAAIFLRDIPENRPWIDRLRLDLKKWEIPQANILKIGTHTVQPYRHVNRAYALFNMGLSQKAVQESVEALRIEPYNAKAHKLLGKIYNEQGKFQEAFESLRKAKLVAPDDMKVRYQMALSLFHLDKIGDAKKQCQTVLDENANFTDGLILLSMIYAQERDFDAMMNIVQRIRQNDSLEVEGLLKIGNYLSDQGEYHRAKKLYTMAKEIEPNNKEIQVLFDMNQVRITHD